MKASKAIVIAQNQDVLKELAGGARALADQVIAISFCGSITGIANKLIDVSVPEFSIVDDAYLTVNAVVEAERPDIVLIEASRRMQSLAGRLANHCKTTVMQDIFEFDGQVALNRYFGGLGQRKNEITEGIKILTVAPGLYDATTATGTDLVEACVAEMPARAIKLVKSGEALAGETHLAKAEVVVAAGRGFSEEADLELARKLCAKINGELGCSRPLTEGVNWLPKGAYIGVSGLMLSPTLYVGIGISGQMQHMVGVNSSQTIVAINKDENAPIFKQCDFGIVGDLKTVLPAVNALL